MLSRSPCREDAPQEPEVLRIGTSQGNVRSMLMREVFSLARDVPLAGYWRLGSATDIWSRVCGLLPHDPFTFASTGLVRAEAACPGGPRSALASASRGSDARPPLRVNGYETPFVERDNESPAATRDSRNLLFAGYPSRASLVDKARSDLRRV